jgi:biopolymer transport protein ExbD
MRLSRRKRVHSAVEASSLSDILFFLMLFFLMISTLASPNAIKLLLPKASTGKTVPTHAISLSIDASLDHYIDQRKISLPELKEKLIIEARKYENPTVVLRVDKSVRVEDLVAVVDIVNQIKIPLVIATDKKSE